MAGLDFVHLHVHSSFSLLEGALTIARLAELAKSDNQPALALTDTDNMFGALEFSKSLRVTASSPSLVVRLPWTSVTPITAPVTEMRRPNARASYCWQRVRRAIAASRLSSRAFLDTPANEPPRLKLEWLEGQTSDIVALTGGPGGPLDGAIAAGQSHLAADRLAALLTLFGDRLYVELQRHGTSAERRCEPVLIDLAYDKGVPLVATNEPFLRPRRITRRMTH